MRTTVSVALLVAAALLATGGYAASSAPQRLEFPETSDYPSTDSSERAMVNRGLLAKAVRAAIESGARDRATLELLLAQEHHREGIAHIDTIFGILFAFAAGDPDQVEYAAGIVADHDRRALTSSQTEADRRRLGELVGALRARVPELPREQAARTSRQLIWAESRLAGPTVSSQPMVRAFVAAYEGTEAAGLAEIWLTGYLRDVDEQIARLDALIERHPGSAVGAAALLAKARAIRDDHRGRRADPPQTDPTLRFRRVLAIVEELESGRWPASAAVVEAPRLVADFSVNERDEFAPGNLEWFVEAYVDFIFDHARALQDSDAPGGDLLSAINRIGDLGELSGDRFAAIERAFDRLAAFDADPERLAWQRAELYIRESRGYPGELPEEKRRELVGRAFATLEELASSPDEASVRRARASIAALHAREREHLSAIDACRAYLSAWPDSNWSWIAALRIGQSLEALGDWEAAADAYEQAADRYTSLAPATVLGHVFAARANETLGRFDRALDHYLAAEPAWNDDFGNMYFLGLNITTTRAEIEERIARLTASLQYPEGAQLERGRRLMEQGRWQEARGPLAELLDAHTGSPLVPEARYLAHRAAFEHALELADIEAAQPDQADAARLLGELSRQPWDPAVGAATLALGAIAGRAGQADQARTLTRDALRDWHDNQVAFFAGPAVPGRRDSELVADVTAIRDLLYQPMGSEIYENNLLTWNDVVWPNTDSAYFVVHPHVRVQLADGRTVQVLASSLPAEFDNTLMIATEHRSLLYRILNRLDASRTRPAGAATEAPSRPAGDSIDVLTLWKEFFAERPDHSGARMIMAYPDVGGIEFHDEPRTSASAAVTIGYSGCTVHLEKRDGVWAVTRLSHFWIS